MRGALLKHSSSLLALGAEAVTSCEEAQLPQAMHAFQALAAVVEVLTLCDAAPDADRPGVNGGKPIHTGLGVIWQPQLGGDDDGDRRR